MQDLKAAEVLPQTIDHLKSSDQISNNQQKPTYGLSFLNEQIEPQFQMKFDTKDYQPVAKHLSKPVKIEPVFRPEIPLPRIQLSPLNNKEYQKTQENRQSSLNLIIEAQDILDGMRRVSGNPQAARQEKNNDNMDGKIPVKPKAPSKSGYNYVFE